MPNLLDLLLDPVSLTLFGLYAGLMVWEYLLPARRLPRVRGWKLRGIGAFLLYWLLSSYLPLFWNDSLAAYQCLDLTVLGNWGGTLAGLLIYEAGVYGWHRGMHASTLLWRSFHQLHHSAERLDSYGAFWFSPLDMLGWTALSSLCLVWMVGITPEAAVRVLYTTTFLSIFQHANLCTPQWLGYLIQRPESHSCHHQRGVHTGNFSDLPVFDLLFGTWRNPSGFADEVGFYPGASMRVMDMLLLRDVSTPRTPNR